MNSPPRLSQEGADDFEARLLRSARSDGASANRDRTLAALAIAGTAAAGAAAGTTTKGALATVKGLGSLKWMALIGLSLVGGVAGLAVYKRHGEPTGREHAPIAQPSHAAVPPAAPPRQEPLELSPPADQPTTTTPLPGIVAPRPHAARPRAKTSVATDSLLEEVAILDRSRLRLSQGDAKGAAQTANSYLARFPRGRLAGEAKVIRIRAALLTGGHAAAAPLATSFLREHPDSPHAPAIRKILQTASAPGVP